MQSIIALVLALFLGFQHAAQAADWVPTRPIRIIVPYAAGGGADLIVRRLAERARRALGQPIIVENRAGAGTAIGAVLVAKSPADGYTLLLATSTTLCVNPVLLKQLPYSPRDFDPVASLQALPFMLNVAKDVPVNSLRDLVRYARERPGELNYGTLGIGSSNHVLGGLLSQSAGVKMEPIHFPGAAPALLSLMRGDIKIYFDGISTSIPRIKSGELKGLAVTSQARVPAAPSVPTVAEEGFPAVGLSIWYGLVAPTGTPPDVIKRLNAVFNEAVSSPEMVSSMDAEGTKAIPMTTEAFSTLIREDTNLWRKAIESLNLKLE